MKRHLVALIITAVTFLLLLDPVWVKADGTDVSGTIPLVILSGPTASNVTSSGATISWTTNADSSSEVYYRAGSTGIFFVQTGTSSGPNNNVALSGLTPGSNYQYYVYSAKGGLTADTSLTPSMFTTLSSGGGGFGGGGFGGGGGSGGGSGGGNGGGSTGTGGSTGSGGNSTKYTNVSLGNLVSIMPLRVDINGIVEAATMIITPDSRVRIAISQGSKLLGASGSPLSRLEITPIENLVPPNQSAIVMAFNFLPEGATFSPVLLITLVYDDSKLPAGVTAKDLYIASWDGVKWWQKTGTTVNAETHTVTFNLEHFSQYALIGKIQPINPIAAIPTSTLVRPSVFPSTRPVITPTSTLIPASPTSDPGSIPPSKPDDRAMPVAIKVIMFGGIFGVSSISTALIVLRWRRKKEAT